MSVNAVYSKKQLQEQAVEGLLDQARTEWTKGTQKAARIMREANGKQDARKEANEAIDNAMAKCDGLKQKAFQIIDAPVQKLIASLPSDYDADGICETLKFQKMLDDYYFPTEEIARQRVATHLARRPTEKESEPVSETQSSSSGYPKHSRKESFVFQDRLG